MASYNSSASRDKNCSSSSSATGGSASNNLPRRQRLLLKPSDHDSSSYSNSSPVGLKSNSFSRLADLPDQFFLKQAISAAGHHDLTMTMTANYGSTCNRSKSADSRHVFMPFYEKKGSLERWKVIQEALGNIKEGRIANGRDFQEIILRYNGSYKDKWDFDGFVFFITNLEDKREYFDVLTTLTKMAELAFKLKQLVPAPIPFLKEGMNGSIALSKEQIACLLAHAFFCTYPMRNTEHGKSKRFASYSDSLPLPSINFSSLFKFITPEITANKLKCIFHYFQRVTSDEKPAGKIIFKRQSLSRFKRIDWQKSETRFTDLHVTAKGRIEEQNGLLQVDFANRFIGGGVIGKGCVQEEIWFLSSPELIVARLFTEALKDDEVLIITGSEIYSRHKGYASSFEWDGDYRDDTRSVDGVKLSQMVAMDAIKFHRDEDQLESHAIRRELNKAYCGFSCDSRAEKMPAISTGNWGCGAFGGDKHLKSLIQMMAAAEAGRNVCYFTHQDNDLVDKMSKVHQFIRKHNLSVGDVYNIIITYVERLKNHRDFHSFKLYDYILETFTLAPPIRRSPSPVQLETAV